MRPSVKKRWIRALRSGKYEQTQQTLQDEDGRYCCLGVLCDLIAPDAWGEEYEWYYKKDYEIDKLPTNFRSHLNISVDEQTTLINLNDEDKLDFEEIADWIEDNL